MNLPYAISRLVRHAGFICFPLWLSTASPAVAFGRPEPLSAEKFAAKVEASRKEALLHYPDLDDPNSLFSRAAKAVEGHFRRVKPYDFEDDWNHPLKMAKETARELRVFSALEPVFSEVVPNFTTKNGTSYPQSRVTKMHRDGVTILHDGGTVFIHRDELTEPQREKYGIRWSTEVLKPEGLIACVDSAIQERDKDLGVFFATGNIHHDKRLAGVKFDYLKEEYDRSYEFRQAGVIRHHCDHFTFRLFELAYAAKEAGQREAIERIEKELAEPVPEPFKTRLKELDDRIKARNARYGPTLSLLRGKRCELLRDGQPFLEGVPKRGMLGAARFEISAPEYIRIVSYIGNDSKQLNNASNHWIFKLDLKKAEATLIPEAGIGDQAGISLRIAK